MSNATEGKDTRIPFRIDSKGKEVIRIAAALHGKSMSGFVRDVALREARCIIRDRGLTVNTSPT